MPTCREWVIIGLVFAIAWVLFGLVRWEFERHQLRHYGPAPVSWTDMRHV